MAANLADDIFKSNFMNEECFIWIQISLKLFLGVQLTIGQHASGNGLAPNRRQAIIWTNADSIHWRIYAALGGNEVIH